MLLLLQLMLHMLRVLLLLLLLLLLLVCSADVNGCVGEPCINVVNSNGTCYDVPAPGTGYKCACSDHYVWDGTHCAACNSIVSELRFPYAVSVDAAGNITCSTLGEHASWLLPP
jgi:hypothetical protein